MAIKFSLTERLFGCILKITQTNEVIKMISNDTICTLAKEQHIAITLAPLPRKILGFYSFSDSRPQIVMNHNLCEWDPDFRSVLAEELGHHFTSVHETHPQTGMTYYDRVQHDRIESKAMRWASDFLIPTEQLLCTIEDCSVSCIQELADSFQVTVEFINHKLYYMSCTALYWTLGSGKELCLASLPSIYIFDPITGDIP
jgi:Zn-dependent peptidase ImmA (M78 family)